MFQRVKNCVVSVKSRFTKRKRPPKPPGNFARAIHAHRSERACWYGVLPKCQDSIFTLKCRSLDKRFYGLSETPRKAHPDCTHEFFLVYRSIHGGGATRVFYVQYDCFVPLPGADRSRLESFCDEVAGTIALQLAVKLKAMTCTYAKGKREYVKSRGGWYGLENNYWPETIADECFLISEKYRRLYDKSEGEWMSLNAWQRGTVLLRD